MTLENAKGPGEVLFDFIAERIAYTMQNAPTNSIPYVFVAQDQDGRLLLASNMNAEGMAAMCLEVGTQGAELIDQGKIETGEVAAPTTSGNTN